MSDLDKKLLEIIGTAQDNLYDIFVRAVKNNAVNQTALFAQIQTLASVILQRYQERSQIAIPEAYMEGSDVITNDKELQKILSSLKKAKELAEKTQLVNEGLAILGTPHIEAVKNLIEVGNNLFTASLDNTAKQMQIKISNEAKRDVLNKLAEGETIGKGIQAQKKEALKIFTRENVVSFTDKGGRTRPLSRYAETVVRSQVGNAQVEGTVNRGVEYGIYKFRRVEKNDACPICKPHDNEIRDVEKQGLPPAKYHPNCSGIWVPIV